MNELVLVESQIARDEFVNHVDVLQKVKQLSLLPDDIHVTAQMAARFYEVPVDSIRKVLGRHREEFRSDRLVVLQGKKFSTYFARDIMSCAKYPGFENPKTRSVTLLPRRAVLRLGMLLRDSDVAKQVRHYLLDREHENHVTVDTIHKAETLHWLAENVKLLLQVLSDDPNCLTTISNLYHYAGIPIDASPTERETLSQLSPKLALVNTENERWYWYSCEAIAKKLGLLSISKRPHVQLVAAIIRTFQPVLGVDAKVIRLDDKGTDVTAYRYSFAIMTKVSALLQKHNWPNSIKMGGKVYQVFYQDHPDTHQHVEIS